MKSIEDILKFESRALDGRDFGRLAVFMTVHQLNSVGVVPSNPETWVTEEFTRENVIKRLRGDLAFAFEKALDKRGLSASMMFSVIKMWMWVLDEHEDLVNWDKENYAMYGLPLFKAVAVRYNFDNPIGDDNGDESYYDDSYYDDPYFYEDQE